MIELRTILASVLLLATAGGCGTSTSPPDDVVSALAEHGDEIATALDIGDGFNRFLSANEWTGRNLVAGLLRDAGKID